MRRVLWLGATAALIVLTACSPGSPDRLARSSDPGTTSPAATPPPTSLSPSAPSPAVATNIKVYGDCQRPSFEPKEIILACADHGAWFESLHWTSWTSTRATGTGTLVYNDNIPSHALGHYHEIRGDRVTLTAPVPDPSGQLVWSLMQASKWFPGYDTGPLHGGPFHLATRPI
jgi:hypothetical protein